MFCSSLQRRNSKKEDSKAALNQLGFTELKTSNIGILKQQHCNIATFVISILDRSQKVSPTWFNTMMQSVPFYLELIPFCYICCKLELVSFRSIDFKMELVPLKYRYSSIKLGQNVRLVPFHQFLDGTHFVPFQLKNGTVP